MSRTVHYLCFYANQDNKDVLISYPSVWSKIEYISETIKKCGYCVNILSAAPIKQKGFYRGHTIKHNDGTIETYVSSYKTKYSFLNKINLLYVYLQILYKLMTVDKDDIILIYHSMFYDRPLAILGKLFRKKFILEIEDVFSELCESNYYMRVREQNFFELAQAYLCVNDIIADQLKNNKKKVISYGRYALPPVYNTAPFNSVNQIDLVYAGVIEQQRAAAFLAVDAMRYMNSKYRLHICGFGKEVDLDALRNKIRDYNDVAGEEKIVFHGMLTGEKYNRLLQSCQIALSTHKYDAETISSADHTFPSKILVYMANGLRVVAQRLDCLQRSKVGNIICYYDSPDPKEVARAIMNIDINDSYDGRGLISTLDKDFQRQIKKLLNPE